MSDLLRWLLDLNTLQWGADTVRFGFERPMPAWAWVGVVGGAVAYAVWSYRRLIGPVGARGALALLRSLLLVTLVALIAGPELVRINETVERDWVLVLVDRSASMTIADVPATDDPQGARISRDQQLHHALEQSWPMWTKLAEGRRVVWLGFDAGAFDLDVSDDVIDLGEPAGRRTNLAASLDQALRRAAARPLSGVVILSDGRSIKTPDRSIIRRLQAERVPIYVVPLGSADPVGDLAIRRVEAPRVAFVDDLTPVTVELDRLGAAAELGGTLQLVDESTGLILDERRIEPGAGDAPITLTHRPDKAGDQTWKVILAPDGADLIEGNNIAEVQVELVDRPLRVLYIDGYPRWEQRYLKNLLLREKSIVSSSLLLAPGRKPSQEGDVEIDGLPESPEEWAAYDVVILGDVQSDVFTTAQLEGLRDHIAIRGGGLLWIAGQGATPDSWWGSPLADLLPFTREAGAHGDADRPVVLTPTPLADQFGLLRLDDDEQHPYPAELLDPTTGWSLLRWRQRLAQAGLKPTAETLAYATPTTDGSLDVDDSSPLLLTMRYGAGRVLYVASDDLWRWRYGRGELLYERFWLPLVRLLGRESVSRTGRSATLSVEPRRSIIEQPVRIEIELLDQSLVELGLAQVMVRLTRASAPGDLEPPTTIERTLHPGADKGRTFSATWLPTEAGHWRIEAIEPTLAGLDLATEVIVSLPDDELRHPETNHPLLVSVSQQTGGGVIAPDSLDTLPSKLPNRRVRLVQRTAEPLWDTPIALILVVTLLTAEWAGRRLIRLV